MRIASRPNLVAVFLGAIFMMYPCLPAMAEQPLERLKNPFDRQIREQLDKLGRSSAKTRAGNRASCSHPEENSQTLCWLTAIAVSKPQEGCRRLGVPRAWCYTKWLAKAVGPVHPTFYDCAFSVIIEALGQTAALANLHGC